MDDKPKSVKSIVLQIHIESGKIIKEWDSCSMASKYFGLPRNRILDIAKGKGKIESGFKWILKEEYNNN